MSAFTPHQRDLLIRRVSRAICWSMATTTDREYAERLARSTVAELEISCFSAAAQRRAVEKVIEQLDA